MSNQIWTGILRRTTGWVLPLTVVTVGSAPALAQTERPRTSFIITQTIGQATSQTPAQPTGPNLPISMEDAVQMAMEANLGLRSSRLEIDIAAHDLASARASFLPQTSTQIGRTNAKSQPQRNFDGTLTVPSTTTLNGGVGMQHVLPWYGTNYSVSWNANRRETPGSGGSYNPSLFSNFALNLRQPLWRGLAIDQTRFAVRRQEQQQLITDLNVRQAVIQTDATVRSAYLSLVAARERLNVNQQNLQLSEDALRNSRARVEVGVAPETDILADQVQVANSRVAVIQAEAVVAQAEDNLRGLILEPTRPDYWQVTLTPTDTIELTPREVNLDQAIQEALANRIDRTIARRNLEVTDLSLRVSKNSTLPSLTANVDYSASGTGGRAVSEQDLTRGFGSVLGDAFGGAYPTWTTGVTFSYPLGRSAAEASYASAQIQRQQQELQLRNLDLFIVSQVRDAVRQIENGARQVEAARAALASSEQNLDAENRKFSVGLSTNLELQIRQQSLAQAKLGEVNAIINYNRALIEFDRVLKIR